ncbi:MAG: ABC transporter substrate-binding protein [Planctomycetota bacterium]|jgi:taurine transport system substrate-binding protein
MNGRNLAVVALGLSLAACGDKPATTAGSGGGEDQAPAKVETVVYAGSAWYGHAPVWVGIEKGIFEKHGFTVEKRAFGSSPNRLTALESDAAQFASLGEVAMLEGMAQDRTDFYWIGNQDIAPGNEGLVGINIDSIADLKGKRIALNFNTSVHITTALLLKEAGLDINKDVTILRADDSAVVDLVRNGDAEAGCIWEPFYTDLRGLPGAKVLGTDMDTSVYKKFQTMTGPDVICTSRKWFDADPDRAKRFFRAYFECVTWCRENPEELLDLIAKEVGKPKEAVAGAMKNFIWLDWGAQRVIMSDARMFGQAAFASEVLKEIGLIEKLPAFRNWTRPDLFAE